jgi:hypothetical protein
LDSFAIESAGSYYLLGRRYQSDSEHIKRFREWLLNECKGGTALKQKTLRPRTVKKHTEPPRATALSHHGPRKTSRT